MSVNIYNAQNDALTEIAGREDTSYWEGTQAQWNNLSSADKALWTGKFVIITDDSDNASDSTVTFLSNDIANDDTTKTDSGWTDTAILTSGETLSSVFTKVSNMFKNIRRLWNTVGTTAIPSSLGSTVTSAVDSLNSKFNWTLIDTKTGSNAVSISGYNEYLIIVTVYNINVKDSAIIPSLLLSSSNLNFSLGGGSTSAQYGWASLVSATSTSIKINTCVVNGSDVIASSSISVYGR